MPETSPSTLSLVLNYSLIAFFVASAVWVFIDTRKRGKPLSESLAWALFMGFMFPLAIIVYVYMRRKNLL